MINQMVSSNYLFVYIYAHFSCIQFYKIEAFHYGFFPFNFPKPHLQFSLRC